MFQHIPSVDAIKVGDVASSYLGSSGLARPTALTVRRVTPKTITVGYKTIRKAALQPKETDEGERYYVATVAGTTHFVGYAPDRK